MRTRSVLFTGLLALSGPPAASSGARSKIHGINRMD